MRATTLLNRALNLTGVRVMDVDPGPGGAGGPLLVRVALRAGYGLDPWISDPGRWGATTVPTGEPPVSWSV